MFINDSRILLIVDNPENLEEISAILSKAGCQVEIALNGLYAVTKVISNNYDLVILDLSRPHMSGEEFFSMISSSPGNEELPVVFIIPPESRQDFMSGMDVGEYDFVAFPIREKELLTRVRAQLELQNARRQIKKNESYRTSLNYAYQIQASLLPSAQVLDDQFTSHFLLSLPLEVVSGDFFWMKRIGKHLFVAVADATGHGVPGAFLSVLGISLLNEIAPESSLKGPAGILDKLRDKVKSSLQSNQFKAERYNGLDMAICKIDTDTNEMIFAGAHNSVYISRDTEFIELKGDKQPIGSYFEEKPFRNQGIELHSGDRLYFSSDGFADQLGGGRQPKKFQSKNFKKLLGSISDKPLVSQKEILLQKHLEWRGDQEQVDDILVLGLELPIT